MRKKRHLSKFNLVEIVLAIGVIALGMAAVMALLPPALNANRNSIGDTHAAEIASNMVSYIDKIALECAHSTSEFNPSDTVTTDDDGAFITELGNRFETEAPAVNSVQVPGDTYTNKLAEPYSQFNVESGSTTKPEWMTYIKTDADGVVTPIANVYVWMKNISASPEDHEKIKEIGSATPTRSCFRFYIKVCWPVDAPADAPNRQERVFIHEILRPVK